MNDNYRSFLLVFFLLALITRGYGQFYPVQMTPQLIPPYSVYLTDYATPGTEKLRVIMVQKDLTQPSYQVRLVMRVEWNGRVIMQTARYFNPAPINLSPGVPTIISGAELAPYLDSRNIDFVGYSREQYERTKSLPEGSFQIIFTAYDYRRQDVQVSNSGSSFYYLVKSEPPLINFPACGTSIPMRTPQQIIFSWLPRNTASPNSAGRTVYEFSLYETRPAGRNPNDVVLSTQPVFKTTTELTQLIYGPSEPLLLQDMTYVWRVRATDENGRDAFRNNGYSEVCTFVYGGPDAAFNIGVVENLQAVGETERRAKISWKRGAYDAYKVYYKKTGASYSWFASEVTTANLEVTGASDGALKLYDLEPDTEYETRVQVKKNGVSGPYSEIVKFRTTPLRVAQCGEEAPLPLEGGNPLRNVIAGTVIDVDGMQLTVMEASSPYNDGWYSGYAKVSPAVLGGASYTVKFDRLFLREDRTAGYGRIDILSKGVAPMVEEQLAAQQKRLVEQKQRENRDIWEGVDFYDKIFLFDDLVLDTVFTDPYGNIAFVDATGQQTIIPEIPAILKDAPEKAVIIEDKNGDQWVVQKEGEGYKTSKVSGGGLQTGSNVLVSDYAIDIIKRSLRELRKEYDEQKIDNIKADLVIRRASLETAIAENNRKLIPEGTGSNSSPGFGSESLFYDFVEVDLERGIVDDEFSRLSIEVKTTELELNRALLIEYVSRDLDRKDDYKLIALELRVNGDLVSDFVSRENARGTTDDVIVEIVKKEMVSFIDQVFINYSNSK